MSILSDILAIGARLIGIKPGPKLRRIPEPVVTRIDGGHVVTFPAGSRPPSTSEQHRFFAADKRWQERCVRCRYQPGAEDWRPCTGGKSAT